MATPRKSPYVWATWITKHLSGENHCEWALWFQAHYTYDRVESDMEHWKIDHDRMVVEQAEALRAGGFTVSVEDDNSFRVSGKNGCTLSGIPDLVAVRDGQAIVIDCKTGKRRDSDQQQVLVYMRLLPISHPNYKGLKMTGRVQYKEGNPVDLGLDKLDTQFDASLRQVMGIATDTIEPARTPSPLECGYCKISKSDCPDKIDPLSIEHDLF